MKGLIHLILSAMLLSQLGCAKPTVTLNRVVVLNATKSRIADVQILHEPTRKTGKVSGILPQKTLDIGLPEGPMLADRAVVSWHDASGKKTEAKLKLPYDRAIANEGRHMQLVYVIRPDGTVTVHLEPSQE